MTHNYIIYTYLRVLINFVQTHKKLLLSLRGVDILHIITTGNRN